MTAQPALEAIIYSAKRYRAKIQDWFLKNKGGDMCMQYSFISTTQGILELLFSFAIEYSYIY